MKKIEKKWFVIVLLLIIIVFQGLVIAGITSNVTMNDLLRVYNYQGNCIPDEATAVSYGKLIYRAKTGIDHDEQDFGVKYDKEVNAWNVFLYIFK